MGRFLRTTSWSCDGDLAKEDKSFDVVDEIGIPILVVARTIPIVLTNNPVRCFCSANTCSTRTRIFDFALLGRRIVSGTVRPFGFLRWMWPKKPFFVRNFL